MRSNREKLAGLIDFASGVLEARENVQLTMKTGAALFLEASLTGLPGLALGANDDGSWMRLQRLQEIPPPPIPALVSPFHDGTAAPHPGTRPKLREAAFLDMPRWKIQKEFAGGRIRLEALPADLAAEVLGEGPDEESDPEGIDGNEPDLFSAPKRPELNGSATPALPPEPSDREASTDEDGTSDPPDPEQVFQVLVHLEDRPDVEDSFATWMTAAWEPWARTEAPRRQSIRLYAQFYRLHEAFHAADVTPIEIVWGIGIATWEVLIGDEKTQRIEMPLIDQGLDIDIEADNAIVLLPRATRPMLNLKPYVALNIHAAIRGNQRFQQAFHDLLQNGDDLTPFDPSTWEPFLGHLAGRLSASGRQITREEIDLGFSPSAPDKDLQIASSWAIYARPRSSEPRRLDLEALKRQVEDEEIAEPKAIGGFVTRAPSQKAPDDAFGVDAMIARATSRNTRGWDDNMDGTTSGMTRDPGADETPENVPLPGAADDDGHAGSGRRAAYYFPLPFNAQQAQIIDLIDGNKGKQKAAVTTVTGPPGTGKTHTIANIISHFMAEGRRVLVTARTPEAISAIRGQLPEELRSLAIASVGTDRDSTQQLQEAVSHLSREVVKLDVRATAQEASELTQEIADMDRQITRAEKGLAEIARVNMVPLIWGGDRRSAMDLVSDLSTLSAEHGWFEDRPAKEPPMALQEILVRLRKELPALAADFGYASARIPDAAEVPGGRDLAQAHEAKKAERLRPRVDRSKVPHMAKDSAGAEAMARSVSEEMRKIDSFLEGATPSLRGFALAVHSGKTRGICLEDLKALHQTLAREKHLGTSQKVRYILGQLDHAELRSAAARGAAGEKPVGFGLFNSALKDCVASVRVNDQAPASAEDWTAVVNALSLSARRGEFARGLDPLMRHGFANAAPDAAWDFAEWLEARLSDLEFVVDFLPRFRGIVDALGILFPYDFDHAAVAERLELGEALRAIDGNLPSDFKEPSAIPAIERLLPEDPALKKLPLFAELKRIRDYLGSSGIEAPSLVAMRNQITPELDRLAAVKTRLAAADGDLKALAEAGAPRWAAALRASPETAVEAIPADWPRAWAWAIMTGTVDRIVCLGNGNEHRQNRNDILVRRQRAFTRLIRLRTLLGLNVRMTPDTQVALTTFTQAVARIGRGTGQSAGRFRRAAQEAAQEASIAAPVWIMPEYRIAEQLPPKLEDFDLVILDEASQSDVTAVAALARGKQLLIVGDEQQVSPANVGTKNAVIDALRTTHLAEVPGAALIDAQASIFEIAHRMHPTSHVSLREHFRCAPPIIAFSSQFYDGGLIPLRVPTASERFDPPLVDVHVRNATRAGKLNRAEADWIVEEIARIVSDPRHDDRSIGVISLIGNSQAELIQKLLIEDVRIGTDRMRKHRLIVGDARTMQGQERSVVFLTMVATPDSVLSQTGRADLQRMNVAMSRARDRLYFVHSAGLDELQPGDIKAKALKHLRDPMPDGNRIVDGDVFSLCQSGFERDVLKRLLDAGYRAIPQVKAGGYAIDIVAEGASDARLAIELDGDRFHGPEDWDRDMARQSQLERAGWVFWRVFGSQWYSDPDRWWGELTRSLADLRIEPIGTAAIDGRFTEFVEVDAFERDPGKNVVGESDDAEIRDLAAIADGAGRPQLTSTADYSATLN